MNKTIIAVVLGVVIIIGGFVLSPDKTVEDISTSLTKAEPVKVTETVELKNGDSYDLTASYVEKDINGVKRKMLAYNGSIPGPLIKVPQGAEVTINFKNGTDMNTLLHSHGVRMDNEFDGTQSTQEEMKPGDIFSYKLKFPDAGMYWYHPHVREDYQQELGLYGNYLVVATDEKYWNEVNREVPLILDDILIENGKINLSKVEADRTLMGRYGNMMLVNGETNYQLAVSQGEVIRFYLTNAANARPFNFSINEAQLKLVGGDVGATEREEWRDSVIFGPSERVVVEVLFAKTGTYTLKHKTPEKTYELGKITVSDVVASPYYGDIFSILSTNEIAKASIDPYREYLSKPVDKELNLTIDMMGGMGGSGMGSHMMSDGSIMGGGMMGGEVSADGIEWEDTDMAMMNETTSKDMTKWKIVDKATGKENAGIEWIFKVGDKVKVRITNDASSAHPMQHPIHFHGQRFLVVNQNGRMNDNLVWKDTVMVPAGQYVDILLDTTNPGEWMAHCHIAEHLEAGMMMEFEVR
jgi:suppressor of ftsI